MNERLYYVKYLFAILWKYIEYFAMNLLKRYLSKTFGPNRMIFFQMYRVKATFLSMFPTRDLSFQVIFMCVFFLVADYPSYFLSGWVLCYYLLIGP